MSAGGLRLNLPPLRPAGRAAPKELVARREEVATAMADQPVTPGVEVAEDSLGGVACVSCRPPAPASTVLYLHGGGYRLGSARSWISFASRMAAAAAAQVVIADYRLAPEHPFPAALHDAATAFEALLARDATPPVVAGDSAGGGLAAALTAVCTRGTGPVPAGLVLLSPWVDLTVTSDTYTSRSGTDQLFGREAAQVAAAAYLQGGDPRDPLASPLFADLSRFPPSLVFAGGAETLLGDGVDLTSRLVRAGASVEAHFPAGMQHVWPTLFPHLPESVAAVSAMARFVERVTAVRPGP
ncbi:MAG: alpha/beta hydrolase [Acidimicrobiales bacterium]